MSLPSPKKYCLLRCYSRTKLHTLLLALHKGGSTFFYWWGTKGCKKANWIMSWSMECYGVVWPTFLELKKCNDMCRKCQSKDTKHSLWSPTVCCDTKNWLPFTMTGRLLNLKLKHFFQLYYDLLTVNIISLTLTSQTGKLHRLNIVSVTLTNKSVVNKEFIPLNCPSNF